MQKTQPDIKSRLQAISERLYPPGDAGCAGCIASVQYKRNNFVFQWGRTLEAYTEEEQLKLLSDLEKA